jgi:hypothetical protein
MSRNTIPVDIYTLNNEQRQQLFLALFEADPSLPNILNSEQRRRLFAVLVAIDSSLVGSLPDSTYNAIHGTTNEQVYLLYIFF